MRARAYDIVMQMSQSGAPIDAIRTCTPKEANILEIGGCSAPWFRKKDFANVKATDCLPTDELANSYGIPKELLEEVDYVCGDSKLSSKIPPEIKFDLVVSSHNIEHQPDLVSHLRSIGDILNDDGLVIYGIPDKRATFDVYRPHTVTSDTLLAFLDGRTTISPKSFFDELSKRTADRPAPVDINDKSMAFTGDTIRAYEELVKYLNGDKIEHLAAHCWTFTPSSFKIILMELYMIGLTKLMPIWMSPRLGNTFLCFSEKRKRTFSELSTSEAQLHKDTLLESYRSMTFSGE